MIVCVCVSQASLSFITQFPLLSASISFLLTWPVYRSKLSPPGDKVTGPRVMLYSGNREVCLLKWNSGTATDEVQSCGLVWSSSDWWNITVKVTLSHAYSVSVRAGMSQVTENEYETKKQQHWVWVLKAKNDKYLLSCCVADYRKFNIIGFIKK